MRCYIVLLTLSLLACTYAQDRYSDRYDNIDILSILGNEQQRNEYYNCLMGMGPCVTEAQNYFKGIFPEMITTNCRKCTPRQNVYLFMVQNWYQRNQPERWTALVNRMNSIQQQSQPSGT
ncbi:ejaculatory bulb-specific protein 3-like [Hylaeus anthracinus]|uniref:ejaculatory bulb-specific protein 3-like n=1 Tax=Hylaeus anthracinus TaxID=313031 RepID=UPI0023B88D83|nr:ejaculatory bulb-specific protein 3-like [Hylaeus anthracinus]